MPDVKKILVPVDFSDCSKEALAYATMFAKSFSAEVHVLHVWVPVHYAHPGMIVDAPEHPRQSLVDFVKTQAAKEMDEFLEATEKNLSKGVKGRIESGDPSIVINEISAEYDLVVMGTHGRTGLMHMMMGSVAEKVVRRAVCPVLTVRHQHLAS